MNKPRDSQSNNLDSGLVLSDYDCIIIGAGHNGLVCANYLAKAGKKVLVLEKRAKVGGAAATDEVFTGYKFSRFSYVFSIFREKIVEELFPKNWRDELVLYPNEPALFVPTKSKKYLLISNNKDITIKNIAQFASEEDAEQFYDFYQLLQETASIIDPLLDSAPVHSLLDAVHAFIKFKKPKKQSVTTIVQLLNSSSANILNQWFNDEKLKAALSYSGTVGQAQSPYTIGSAFLQLHHVANTISHEGVKSRFYPRGGMGAISEYLAKLAKDKGVDILTNVDVKEIVVENNIAKGIIIIDGNDNEKDNLVKLKTTKVISNCSYDRTFKHMLHESEYHKLPETFKRGMKSISYSTNCSKINLVLRDIPDFACLAGEINQNLSFAEKKQLATKYMHNTLIVGEHMQDLHSNYLFAEQGKLSAKPTIQMLMPSLLDDSLTPKNSKTIVCLLFVQYTPYKLDGGWTDEAKQTLYDNVMHHINQYAPNFSSLVIHKDIVCPTDIENILGLTGGNIFQGAMDLDNLNTSRPMPEYNQYKTPIKNLYSCSSANHPGGGVCGAPGRNSAKKILDD